MNINNEQLKDFILSCLDEKKAENITCLSSKEKTPLYDWVIIASGRSLKNIQAIAEYTCLELKHKLHCPSSIEGLRGSDWILVDAGSVVLHLFHPAARDIYKLEELWG